MLKHKYKLETTNMTWQIKPYLSKFFPKVFDNLFKDIYFDIANTSALVF